MKNLDSSGTFVQMDGVNIKPRGPYLILSPSQTVSWVPTEKRRICLYCGSNHINPSNCPNCGAPDRSKHPIFTTPNYELSTHT